MSKIKVVHYINQFFANIGGEEKADYPAEIRVGEIVGPGMALTQKFGDEAEIVATIVCGDSYFNENLEKAKADILAMVKEQAPDIFVAGPAFNAGRYGVACGTICDAVQEELGIPAVTGMYVENPGADMFKNKVYTVSTKNSAAGMRDAVNKLAPLALKIAKGEPIGASCQEGYMPVSYTHLDVYKRQTMCCLICFFCQIHNTCDVIFSVVRSIGAFNMIRISFRNNTTGCTKSDCCLAQIFNSRIWSYSVE